MRTTPPDPAAALFGRSMRAVLGLLFGHPERAFYLREIARAAGTSPSSLQRELAALTAAGLALREVRGHQVYFRANPDAPLFAELRGIAVKSFGIAEVLRNALAPLGRKTRAAFIYGSFARSEARPESDVDVMVVGEARFAEVVDRLRATESALQRSVNPTVYPAVEFARKAQHRHAVSLGLQLCTCACHGGAARACFGVRPGSEGARSPRGAIESTAQRALLGASLS